MTCPTRARRAARQRRHGDGEPRPAKLSPPANAEQQAAKQAATRWARDTTDGTATTTGDLPEARLQERVQALATDGGWRWHHCGAPGGCSGSGWPDLVMLRGGETLIVELKTADGSPTAEQVEWLTAWQRAGAECHVWRPADLSEITRRLQPTDAATDA